MHWNKTPLRSSLMELKDWSDELQIFKIS